MSKNIKAVATSEYNAVIAVAEKYVDGLRIGSPERLEEAFHEQATNPIRPPMGATTVFKTG